MDETGTVTGAHWEAHQLLPAGKDPSRLTGHIIFLFSKFLLRLNYQWLQSCV